MYAFEPAARAKLPVTRFKEAAEKYGYIVVCSREARNGPAGPIHKAIAAIWQDTHERFVIDANRVYGTGFSGGARMASRLHYLTRQGCAGIIACGAGISHVLKNKPQMLKPAFWYGIVGIADFNYNEVMTLDKTLDSIGVDHHVEVTETQHQWGEVDVLNRAVEWMETLAVKKGHLKKDDAYINSLYTGYLDRAGKMLADGKTFYAAAVYNSAHVLFNGLTDTSEAEKAAGQLKDSKAYKKFQKEEKARLLKEQELIKSASMALYFLENPKKIQGSPKKVIRDLNISYLLKEAKKGKDIYYKGLGKRLLASLMFQTTNRGYVYLGKKEYKKAVEFFKIGIKIRKDNGPAYYDLTCAYSLMNDKKK
ncbi:MAG: hypothetical protein GY757_07690, partial [bacterium]|nr:hypothetical protein [bacterium]